MAYFLNALYTMFDSVTDKYNIFKVFNISFLFSFHEKVNQICFQVDKVNDTHMIASGVPEKNGDKHAPGVLKLRLLTFQISWSIVFVSQRLRRWHWIC